MKRTTRNLLIVMACVMAMSTILIAASAAWTASYPSWLGLTVSNAASATAVDWSSARTVTSLTVTVVGPATGTETDRGDIFVAPSKQVEKCGSVSTMVWAHVTSSNSCVLPVCPAARKGTYYIYTTNHCTTTYEVKPL